MTSVSPTRTASKTLNPQNQHACRNCTKSHAPGRASFPAQDSTYWSCGRIGQWDVRCWRSSGKHKDLKKKPPRHGPNGGKQKQTHIVHVEDDYDQQCDEVCVITIDVQPHHSASLGQRPRDDHARPSVLLAHMAQNAHSATIIPSIGIPYPAPSEPENINITAFNIDALTKAWATVTMPDEMGPNHHGNFLCKVDTGASGYVMPLHVFAKLFPRHITPTRLHPCDTRLTLYNGSNIPLFGAPDTTTEWTSKGHQCSKHLQTKWYVADSSGPAILSFPSSSKLGIIQLSCAVKHTNRCDPSSPSKTPTTACANGRHDLTSPLNSSEDLIKAYPNWFEGIGWFPVT